MQLSTIGDISDQVRGVTRSKASGDYVKRLFADTQSK